MQSLNGLTALVTGSSRGIGKAIAVYLQEMGADIIISGSNEQTLAETAKELNGCRFITANLSEPESIEKLALQTGEVDILVNNAGITRDALFLRQSEDQWNEVLRVNLDAAVALTRALTPHMVKQGFGRIINVSSIVAHMGNIGQTNYITSKAAITGFTKGLAKEIARKGITVNCIAPGFIETSMTKDLPEAVHTKIMEQIPARTFGKPEDIAAAAGFLASKEAQYVTGTTLHVNGGMYV
ncbi:MAG: beta-ketoacyl-ACP reductase [Alphaproteobacteria bacterium]|nr:beta-ketoacyl-ACP reductase [Alphaproteobacteria bacterium]MDD9919506.1 beta-ketoacyl-ACP reductase [Alphaproteobacteria bacterium]